MHQIRRDLEQPSGSSVSLLLILANTLDCQTFSMIFSAHRRALLLEATADVEFGLARCRRLSPQILVIDPKASQDIIQQSVEMLNQCLTRHVVLLDDRVHEGRLHKILKQPMTSYLTRHSSWEDLMSALLRIADHGDRMFDREISGRITRSTQGLRLRQNGHPSIADLTARELQVMGLLAQGQSVRDCAKHLNLSASTIDNHKSRMMKKLKLHKATEITHVAIRDGVITI